MCDSYLIPGQLCQVWNNSTPLFREGVYFLKYDKDNRERFLDFWPLEDSYLVKETTGQCFDNYRPVGTEWDFAPDWVCGSLIDSNGKIILTDKPELFKPVEQFCYRYSGFKILAGGNWVSKVKCEYLICGKCPNRIRYEGRAWKTSLRMRPEWAKVKK